ncbi:hypothetical protein L6452_25861 [Arctium lappa]|uniref:Uncharacterized protein n=1 Tax=Arctium lappa TaxID=4217 RepID=A0ACB9ACJ0_ARCLA|nr:hypothetical protein L6452_25861 [Arctium lappa]
MIRCLHFRRIHHGLSFLNVLLQPSYHRHSLFSASKLKYPDEDRNSRSFPSNTPSNNSEVSHLVSASVNRVTTGNQCYGKELDEVKSWNRMITDYIRHGDLHSAHNVFENMSVRTTVTWNSMLAGYTKIAGRIEDARQLFDKIPEPDIVSYNTMLNCYMHNCGIKAAQAFFDQMLFRDTASWNTMVSGFCQNGMIDQAYQLFQVMPEKNNVSWNLMISGYAGIGDLISAEKLFRNAPSQCVVAWTAMVTGYMKSRKVDLAEKVFDEMPEKNLVTWNTMVSGYSWIEIKHSVHEFRSSDRLHPELDLIHEKLNHLEKKMRLAGYVPVLEFALHDVGDQQKEKLLLWHSEKLAIAYGLIRITENARVVIIGELDFYDHAVLKPRIVLSHCAACISFRLSNHRSFKHEHNSTMRIAKLPASGVTAKPAAKLPSKPLPLAQGRVHIVHGKGNDLLKQSISRPFD